MHPTFVSRASQIMRLLGEKESSLPKPKDDGPDDAADDKEEDAPDDTENGGDEDGPPEEDDAPDDFAPPAEEPIEPELQKPVDPTEQLYTKIAIQALLFDPENIRPKDLVVYDITNPAQIFNTVRRIIGASDQTLAAAASAPPTEAPVAGGSALPGSSQVDVSGGDTEPFLTNQRYIVAQLILKALRYDPDDLVMASDLVNTTIDGTNARDVQKQLETLLGYQQQSK